MSLRARSERRVPARKLPAHVASPRPRSSRRARRSRTLAADVAERAPLRQRTTAWTSLLSRSSARQRLPGEDELSRSTTASSGALSVASLRRRGLALPACAVRVVRRQVHASRSTELAALQDAGRRGRSPCPTASCGSSRHRDPPLAALRRAADRAVGPPRFRQSVTLLQRCALCCGGRGGTVGDDGWSPRARVLCARPPSYGRRPSGTILRRLVPRLRRAGAGCCHQGRELGEYIELQTWDSRERTGAHRGSRPAHLRADPLRSGARRMVQSRGQRTRQTARRARSKALRRAIAPRSADGGHLLTRACTPRAATNVVASDAYDARSIRLRRASHAWLARRRRRGVFFG